MKSFRNIEPDESIFNFVKDNIEALNEAFPEDAPTEEYRVCLKILEMLTDAAIADRQLNINLL